MKYNAIKFLACLIITLVTCLSCIANDNSSQTSTPNVKTTQKVNKKTAPEKEQATKQDIKSNSQLHVVTINSAKMGRDITNLVVTPSSYESDTIENFPVVYLLHGFSDNYMAWQNHVDLTKYADKYNIIIVCPDAQDSWYFDSPIDPTFQFETFITQELRSYVESNFRTVNDARYRAITGLSMGGHGALWLAWRHPDIYSMCGSMSGAVDITTLKDRFKIDKRLGKYAVNEVSWKNHSVINLVPTLKNNQFIIIDDGTSDFLIKENRALHAALQQHNIRHEYSERPGRHSWDYWLKSLEIHLKAFYNRMCMK